MSDENKKNFGRRLKQLLEDKQLSLKNTGDAIGTSAVAVHKWTHGGEIDYGNLRALAHYLDVNWLWLRYGEEAIPAVAAGPAGHFPAPAFHLQLGELLQSDERIHLVLGMTGLAIWEWEIDQDRFSASPNAAEVFGQPIHSMQELLARIHQDDRGPLAEKFRQTASPGEPYAVEYRIRLPDGRSNWIVGHGVNFLGAHGRPARVISSGMNMTTRKQAEAVALERQMRLDLALHATELTIWEHDLQTNRITVANPALAAVGQEPEAHMHAFMSRVHPEDRALVDLASRKALASGAVEQVEFRIIGPHGQTHWLASRMKGVLATAAGHAKLIGVTADISQRKQAEQEMHNRQRRLELLLAHAHLGVWEVDLKSGQVNCTDKAARMLGFRAATDLWVEAQLHDILHPEDRSRVLDARNQAMQSDGHYQIAYRILLPGGGEKTIHQDATLEKNSVGEWVTCYGTLADGS